MNDTTTASNFIIPEQLIKKMYKQVHSVGKIENFFTTTTSFVTYRLSHVDNVSLNTLRAFAHDHVHCLQDSIVNISYESLLYHSFMKAKNGEYWILPKNGMPKGTVSIGTKVVKVYVNFDTKLDNNLWYLLELFYDVLSIVDASKSQK